MLTERTRQKKKWTERHWNVSQSLIAHMTIENLWNKWRSNCINFVGGDWKWRPMQFFTSLNRTRREGKHPRAPNRKQPFWSLYSRLSNFLSYDRLFQNQPINCDLIFSRAFTEHRFTPLNIVIVSETAMWGAAMNFPHFDAHSQHSVAPGNSCPACCITQRRRPQSIGVFLDPLMFALLCMP